MSAIDEFRADAVKMAASYYAKPVGVLVAVLLFGWAMSCHGRQSVKAETLYQARVDTVRITDSVFTVAKQAAGRAVKEARVATARSDASDRPVAITSDSTISVTRHDTTIIVSVPPEVTKDLADLRAAKVKNVWAIDSLTIALSAADSTIRARDKLLATPRPREHWGIGVGLGYACNQKGCGPGVAIGLTWRW